MPRPSCSLCGTRKFILNTEDGESWVCTNCDQYPWIISPMTGEAINEQDAKASQIARRAD